MRSFEQNVNVFGLSSVSSSVRRSRKKDRNDASILDISSFDDLNVRLWRFGLADKHAITLFELYAGTIVKCFKLHSDRESVDTKCAGGDVGSYEVCLL